MNDIKFGYDLPTWQDYAIPLPIQNNIKTAPHLLLIGASGSGKSYALMFYLWQLCCQNKSIWLLDFKNSEDFRFLHKNENFYSGTNCISAISNFYAEFQMTKESGKVRDRPVFLICDEFPAMILYLEGIDKKRASEIKNQIAEILMLGRSWGYGIWITTQRPDANFFSNGARDNFMNVIALGRLSTESKRMLFAGEEIPSRPFYQKGEGLILMDGYALQELKVPQISSLSKMKSSILKHF